MPTMHLIRESSSTGSAVTLELFVDGQRVLALDNGKSGQGYISSGEHELQIKYDGVFSNPDPRQHGPSYSSGESQVLHVTARESFTLRCGFNGFFASMFGSSVFFRLE